jgi:nucleoside diphosphate kinase
MLSNVKITENEMKFIQLLQNMTGATVVDCIIEGNGLIFTVKKDCGGKDQKRDKGT